MSHIFTPEQVKELERINNYIFSGDDNLIDLVMETEHLTTEQFDYLITIQGQNPEDFAKKAKETLEKFLKEYHDKNQKA